MAEYIALLHKEKKSDYGISFPDFPGCISAAKSLEEAKNMAQEVLQFHIDGMIEDNEQIPEPSLLETIIKKKTYQDSVAFLVSAKTTNEKHIRINVTLPESLVDKATKYSQSHHMSRSALIAESLRKIFML